MNILTLTLKNICFKKMRSALTLCAVAVSIAAFVSLIGLSRNMEQTLTKTYKTRGTDLIAIEKGAVDILSSTIDQKMVDELRLMPRVSEVSPILVYFYSLGVKDYVLVYGWEKNSYLFNDLKIEGDFSRNPQELILGKMCAARLKKKIGDTLKIRNKSFIVSGIFQAKSLLEDGAVIMPLEVLQEIKGTKGKVTSLNIKLNMPDASRMNAQAYEGILEAARKELARHFADIEIKNVQTFISANTPVFMLYNFLWAVSVIAFVIVAMGVTSTMTTSVMERTKEIGIVLAIGWRKSTIVSLVLFEAALIGFVGGALGVILGYGLIYLMIHTPQLKGLLSVTYDYVFMFQSIAISTLLGLFSGFYPACRAISVECAQVLRYE